MKITDLEHTDDGIVKIGADIHISELDRLAGKVINYIASEMPELSTSHAVEVLSVALWWVQFSAYNHFGKEFLNDPEQIRNSYWNNIGNP